MDLAGFTAMTEVHGDAVMLAFESPAEALLPIRIPLSGSIDQLALPAPRTGLHHGPAIERDGDWFGNTANLAARVAGQAAGGQSLATSGVAATARGLDIPTVELGCFQLRNIAEPVEPYEIALVDPIPGISRSGATISAGVHRGMSWEEAARFSFLLLVPAIVLSGAFGLRDLGGGLPVMMATVATGRLGWFVAYRCGLAAVLLVVLAMG